MAAPLDEGRAQSAAATRVTVKISARACKNDGRSVGDAVHVLRTTVDNEVLEHTPGAAWTNVRYVRVNTTASVSWVAWKEIELYVP